MCHIRLFAYVNIAAVLSLEQIEDRGVEGTVLLACVGGTLE